MASKRQLTDNEIGLIKAMLDNGMRNQDIHFYFNQADRTISSGRITNIKQGNYGNEIPRANSQLLDQFLENFYRDNDISISKRASLLFELRKGGHWHLKNGETTDQECKEVFNPKNLYPLIKAIAAFANARGGFIFFGIKDEESYVEGLPDTAFQDTDIANIMEKVKSHLSPTPIFSKHLVELGDKVVGAIYVEKQKVPPVMVCRDGTKLTEGSILFRYSGSSSPIRFGDLHNMLIERDQAAHSSLLKSAARLSEIGLDQALILDAKHRTIDAGDTKITIDQDLANQLNFIREGEFDERKGAPALRLIGTVKSTNENGEALEQIIRRNLTATDVLRAYLYRNPIHSLKDYIGNSNFVQKQWLPIYYFIKLEKLEVADAIQLITETEALFPNSKKKILHRLHGNLSAFKEPASTILPLVEEIISKGVEGEYDLNQTRRTNLAIQGLPDDFENTFPLIEFLKESLIKFSNDKTIISSIFLAASRLDEIESKNSNGTFP